MVVFRLYPLGVACKLLHTNPQVRNLISHGDMACGCAERSLTDNWQVSNDIDDIEGGS